jgi:GntR family transcriptional repressor for pyruvate dehydrogenase complex
MASTVFAEPIKTTRTFEAAVQKILDGIERNRLRTGDRLPTEDDLAGQLGISKPTLRQALRVLEQAGLLTVRSGKGGGIFIVSEIVPHDAIKRTVALEGSAIVDVLRARRVLESTVAAVATMAAEAEDFEDIERTIEINRAHLGNREEVMRADSMFHRAVVRACHNVTLEEAMRVVAVNLAPVRDAYQGGATMDAHTLEIHVRQLDAMRKRDLAALAAVLDDHFRLLEDAFAQAMKSDWSELFGDLSDRMLGLTGPA